MKSRHRLLAATALLSAVVACTTEVIERQADPAPGTNPDGTTTETNGTTPAGQTAIAGAVTVDRVSLYQGVEVRLVKSGAEVDTRNAPILTNRPALVRVSAAKDASVRVGKVTAKLHVKIDGEEKVLTDGPKSITTYDDTTLDSTFNFQLTAEEMTTDMEISVELVGASDTDTVAFPAVGDPTEKTTISLNAQQAAKLRVELVPVKYEADGSSRTPVLDDANVKRYHDALYQMYPVSEVEITQHAQLSWEVPIAASGTGWDQLLNAVMNMRQDENVDPDVYYVGVFNPAATIREYCKAGCVLGIAPAAGFANPSALDTQMALRSALVVGYQTDHSGGTISQELAHAMGRLHAPCGNPAAIDKKYPYKEANLGSTGWDVISKELVSSDDHSDFMSYCSPVWVSDYTYKAIFDRMTKVQDTLKTQKSVKSIAVAGATGNNGSLPSFGGSANTSIATNAKLASKLPVLAKDQIAWTIQQP